MRPRSPRLSQNCTAIFIATSTATEPLSQKNTRLRGCRQKPCEPARQRQRRFMREAAEHHMRHGGELARHGLARYGDDYSRGRRSTSWRCRRSVRGHRPELCANPASPRPAAAAARSASAYRAARYAAGPSRTSRGRSTLRLLRWTLDLRRPRNCAKPRLALRHPCVNEAKTPR